MSNEPKREVIDASGETRVNWDREIAAGNLKDVSRRDTITSGEGRALTREQYDHLVETQRYIGAKPAKRERKFFGGWTPPNKEQQT